MRKKQNLNYLSKQATEEDINKRIQRSYLREQIGIVIYFDGDSTYSKKANKEYTDPYFKITDSQFRSINTQYKSFADYDRDKNTADSFICDDKPIPEDLYNRLVQTRIELEQAGLLEPYEE